jgi:UDP-GlcNAc:undecaprenyl-phosphate GlcNAc-1-phosphate transferase
MANLQNLLIYAVAGFAVSFAAIIIIIRAWLRLEAPSRFAEFHHAPSGQTLVPRFGGLALAAAFGVLACIPANVCFGLQVDPLHWVIDCAALAMFGLGMWDDLYNLGAKRKLAGQAIIASVAYFLGLGMHRFKIPLYDHVFDLGVYAWPVTVLWLVAITNIIRLIDGADGLAGVVALMLMILLSVVSDSADLAPLMAVGMAGALLAFLCFNLPPARICLGAGGAHFLGFLIGALALYDSHQGKVVAALVAPLMVLLVPILDAAVAMARRGMLGLPLFRPYGPHLQQELLKGGVSREGLALGTYAFTAFFLCLALIAYCWRSQSMAVVLGGATLSLLWLASRLTFSQEWLQGRVRLGTSARSRVEFQYALAQADWLAMEGGRGESLLDICEDTAWIARKLGFNSLHIHLGDDEKAWKFSTCEAPCDPQATAGVENLRVLANSKGCRCQVFRHYLPGTPDCWMELQTPDVGEFAGERHPRPHSEADSTNYQIIGEVLAEGWTRSLTDWQLKNKVLALRFPQTSPEQEAGKPSLAPNPPIGRTNQEAPREATPPV